MKLIFSVFKKKYINKISTCMEKVNPPHIHQHLQVHKVKVVQIRCQMLEPAQGVIGGTSCI